MIFRTDLSSSNFAVNAAEGNPEYLSRLFPGMTVETAKNVIARGAGRCRRPAANEIDVPDELCAQ